MEYRYSVPEFGRPMQWPMPDKWKASEGLRKYYYRTIGKQMQFMFRYPYSSDIRCYEMSVSAAPGLGPWVQIGTDNKLPKGWY